MEAYYKNESLLARATSRKPAADIKSEVKAEEEETYSQADPDAGDDDCDKLRTMLKMCDQSGQSSLNRHSITSAHRKIRGLLALSILHFTAVRALRLGPLTGERR